MKPRKHPIPLLAMLLVILLCSCASCSFVLENLFHDPSDYPKDARYYCQELDMTLSFSTLECTVRYKNETDEFHIFKGVRLIMGNYAQAPTAIYQWDQANDMLILKFDRIPEEIDCSKEYYFHRINK